jgi:O-antigen/teichoic acid export membrane protein
MGVLKQQSLRASLVTYAGVLLGMLNVFVIYPLFLDKELIGLLKSLESVALLVGPFIYGGFPFAINKFYPLFKDFNKPRLSAAMTAMLIFLMVTTLLATIVFILFKSGIAQWFSDKSPLLSDNILFAIPVYIGMAWMVILSYISASNLKLAIPRLMDKIFIRIIQAVIVALFFFSVFGERTLIWIFFLSYLLPTFLLFAYVYRRNYLKFDLHRMRAGNFTFTEEFNYVKLLTFSMVGASVIANTGMMMIGAMLGLEWVAVFFIAFYMGYILEVPALNFSQLFKPVISESLEKGDIQNVKNLYQKSAVVQTLISGFLFLLICANLNEIFAIMPNGHLFVEGKWVVVIISLGYLLKNLAGCHFDVLIMSKYYRLSVGVTVVMAVLTIISFYFFTRYFGFMGAAYASALTTVIHSALVVTIVYGLFRIMPLNKKNLMLIFILAVMTVVAFFLPELSNPFVSAFYKSTLITMVFLPLVYMLKISEDVNEQMRLVVKKLVRR